MSIGSRIMEIRKKNNLSQEAFGETLGVSRQAISKWEMDASIPDVDKLILMSQIYQVSVGYILGMEEERKTASANGGEDDTALGDRGDGGDGGLTGPQTGELTPQQLKMVEEIVKRYLEARPEPRSLKKKNTLAAAALVAASFAVMLFLCLFLVQQQNATELDSSVTRLDQKYQNVSENIQGLYNKVMDLEYDISQRLESQLQEVLDDAYETVIDHGWEWLGYDSETDTFTLSVYAEAKVYSDETQAVFVAVGGGQETKVTAVREAGRFSAEIVCPRSSQLELRLLLINDGVTQIKQLDTITDPLQATFPEYWVIGGPGLEHLPFENGTVKQEDYQLRMTMASVMDGPMGEAQPIKATLTYYVNREKYIHYDIPIEIVDGKAKWDITFDLEIPLEEGDTVMDVIAVIDSLGRQARMIRSACKVADGEWKISGSATLSELPE